MTIKIFTVSSSSDQYYRLFPVNNDLFFGKIKRPFSCIKMRDDWDINERFYVKDPARTTPADFYGMFVGALSYSEKVYHSRLGEIIEDSGEILHAKIDGDDSVGVSEIYISNIIACFNCLLRSKSVFETSIDGKMITQIKKYGFDLNRMSGNSLFKIPEMVMSHIYTVSGLGGEDDDFYLQYMKGGFTGLKFTEVWCDRT